MLLRKIPKKYPSTPDVWAPKMSANNAQFESILGRNFQPSLEFRSEMERFQIRLQDACRENANRQQYKLTPKVLAFFVPGNIHPYISGSSKAVAMPKKVFCN